MAAVRRSKYGAIRTTVDGVTFASKAEAARYVELRILERAGQIRELELQPRYGLNCYVRGGWVRETHRIGEYVADFRYRAGSLGILVVEDVKGVKTALYRWKKRHVEAEYGITIVEIGGARRRPVARRRAA